MIIENTLDMARFKVLVPKFVKWVVKAYDMIVDTAVKSDNSKLAMTNDLSSFLYEKNIQCLTVTRLSRVNNLPLSVFMMKNNPKYISVAIDHQKLEYYGVTIEYYIGGTRNIKYLEGITKFCPFKHGLILDPLHKGILEIMRIDKETGHVRIVNNNGSLSKKLSFVGGELYNLDHFDGDDNRYNSKFNNTLTNGHLQDFDYRVVSVPFMKFTKPLPVEEDIKAYLMRYPKVVV